MRRDRGVVVFAYITPSTNPNRYHVISNPHTQLIIYIYIYISFPFSLFLNILLYLVSWLGSDPTWLTLVQPEKAGHKFLDSQIYT